MWSVFYFRKKWERGNFRQPDLEVDRYIRDCGSQSLFHLRQVESEPAPVISLNFLYYNNPTPSPSSSVLNPSFMFC